MSPAGNGDILLAQAVFAGWDDMSSTAPMQLYFRNAAKRSDQSRVCPHFNSVLEVNKASLSEEPCG